MTQKPAVSVADPPALAPEAAYDLAAPYYDAWKWQAFWHAAEWPFLRDAVHSWTGPAGAARLIDVGCGSGW